MEQSTKQVFHPDPKEEQDNSLVGAGNFLFVKHDLATWITSSVLLDAAFFAKVGYKYFRNGFEDLESALKMSAAAAGMVIIPYVAAGACNVMKRLFQESSEEYEVRKKDRHIPLKNILGLVRPIKLLSAGKAYLQGDKQKASEIYRDAVSTRFLNARRRYDVFRKALSKHDYQTALEHFYELARPSNLKNSEYFLQAHYGASLAQNIQNEKIVSLLRRGGTAEILDVASSALFLEDYDTALKNLASMAEDSPVESKVMHALILDAIASKGQVLDKGIPDLRTRQWKATIDSVVSSPDAQTTSINGSRAYFIGPSESVRRTFAFKESIDPEDLKLEKRATERLEGIIQDSDEFDLARPLTLAESNGNFYFVTTFANGQSLDQLDGKQAYEVFKMAARYLGLIHSKMISIRSKRDMKEVSGKRIANSDYQDLKVLTSHWDVVWDNINGDYVFDKDAHPLNWIYSPDGKLYAIDNTDKGYVPQQFDLVKLLERCEFFEVNPHLKQHVIDEYLCAYGNPVDTEAFEMGYHNSIIAMAINHRVVDYGSKPGKIFVHNAITAIDDLRQRFSGNYSAEQLREYEKMKEIFEQIPT